MKGKKHCFVIASLLIAALPILAQTTTSTQKDLAFNTKKLPMDFGNNSNEQKNRHFIKLNLTSLALKNYSIQYERTLGRKFSAAISCRLMPNTSLPFKGEITKSIGGVSYNMTDLVNNLKISNFAITPEVRLYLSKKGYGHGFYIAPFYRLSTYKTNSLKVNFTGENGAQNSLNLSGNLTSNTVGILFGAQWNVGKQMCIDWSIAGPHYGVGNGNFIGSSSNPLTQREQDELYRQIDNLNVPFSKKKVHTNASGGTLDLNGPWAGVRAALSFGIRF
ncbi:MAG: DUF3575 domain-containing protein [Bacteroidota bacterium]|nr:DUF3575 domain-containing protein [Bacteroidota bacterium]